MNKNLILEKKSVSDDIIAITTAIYDEIKNDFDKVKLCLSTPYGIEFKENVIRVPLNEINEKLGNLTVHYVIYFFDSKEEQDYILSRTKLQLNSQYDDRSGVLTMVTSYFPSGFAEDTEGIIYHEVTHFYQYAMGMEKRVDLYKRMYDYIDGGNNDIDAYYVALALYYTFPHEQDAFAHEFYSLVCQRDGNMSIDEYTEYGHAKHAYEIVKHNYKGNKYMLSAIKSLGYNVKDYLQRLHYGLKRFEKKLYNVLIRYEVDKREQEMTSEQRMKMNIKIGTKYLLEGKPYVFPKRKYEHFFEF